MTIYKLYKNGNISDDVEPEDVIVPTKSSNFDDNIGIRGEADMFIKHPDSVDIKAPWTGD